LTNRARMLDAYRWFIVATAAVAFVLCSIWLPAPQLDWRFLILTTVMMGVSSRFSIQIPRVNTNVTISDTFIFLVLLLYGGIAGILVAAFEGLSSGLRISRRPLTVIFNSAMMAASTAFTVMVMKFFFGPIGQLRFQDTSHFIVAAGVMALMQYFSNSGICAIGLAVKQGAAIWRTWQTHYMWTSITYLAGAALAAFASTSIEKIGLAILFVGAPIILIVYFTYHKYLNEIKTTS